MAKTKTMEDLLLSGLKDLYDAEKQLVKAIPKMAKATTSGELREGFLEHLEQTKEHVNRLEKAFSMLGQKASGKKCVAMQGLIEEGEEVVDEIDEGPVRDAALIGAAQRVEHYEMAGYGCGRTFAETLGHSDVAELLQRTLDEEKATDEKLTEIAEGLVNEEAVQSSGRAGA